MDTLQADDGCLSSLIRLLFHQQPPESKYWDATGKPGSGLYDGNFIWLGDYNECQAQDNGLYCLAQIHSPASSLLSQPTNNQSSFLQWGLCAVKACKESTISKNMQLIISATLGLNKLQVTKADVHCARNVEGLDGFHATFLIPTPDSDSCTNTFQWSNGREHQQHRNQGVIIFLLLLCLLGTFIDLYHKYRVSHIPKLVHRIDSTGAHLVYADGSPDEYNPSSPSGQTTPDDSNEEWNRPPDQQRLVKAYKQAPSCCVRFWQCFSLNYNLKQLWTTRTSDATIRCLHGLRVVSMAWIILGHTFLGAFGTGFIQNSVVEEYTKRVEGQVVANAYFAIDTFFFLSGLLVCYLTLKLLNDNDGCFCLPRFIIHRYLRLTPSVAFTMLLWIFVLPRLVDGPLAYQLVSNTTCKKYWWTNLLYIQNFYPTSLKEACMGWLWYVAVDMQFYIISPIIIHLIFRSAKKGYVLISLMLVSSLVVSAVLIGYYKIEVNLTNSVIHGNASVANAYEDIVFDKPYCRIAPYLIGMLLGYMLYKYGATKRRIGKMWVMINWLLCTGTMISLVFGLYWTFHGYPMRLSGNILYGSLSHLLWAVALSWVVYTCWHGYAGMVNDVLSWRAWAPLSKLTYGAYLAHPLLMFWYWKSMKTGLHMSSYLMAVTFCGIFTLSYVIAAVMYCLVERPILNLEAFIFPPKNKKT